MLSLLLAHHRVSAAQSFSASPSASHEEMDTDQSSRNLSAFLEPEFGANFPAAPTINEQHYVEIDAGIPDAREAGVRAGDFVASSSYSQYPGESNHIEAEPCVTSSIATPHPPQRTYYDNGPPNPVYSPWYSVPWPHPYASGSPSPYFPRVSSTSGMGSGYPSQLAGPSFHPPPLFSPPPAQAIGLESHLTLELEHQRQEMEKRFAEGLFTGVFPERYPHQTITASCAVFAWDLYGDSVNDGNRLQVVINCMRRTGIATLGDLMVLLFRREPYSHHESVSKTIASFVSGSSRFPQNRPAEIIFDLILVHPHATYAQAPAPVFDVPRYALPPSERLSSAIPPLQPPQTTRNTIINRALTLVLSQVDAESKSLLSWLSILQPPRTKLAWSHLLSWDMTAAQEYIARHAPVMFSVLSTVAVGPAMRKCLNMVDSTAGNGSDDEPKVPSTEVPHGARRDPWLVSNIKILSNRCTYQSCLS